MLEQVLGQGFQSVFGNSMWLGVLTLVWFGVFSLLQNLRMDAKLAILVPASLLAMVYLPIISILVAIVFAVILALAVEKFRSR